MKYTIHPFKLFSLILGIILISCRTGHGQSAGWTTSSDTVTTTGYVKMPGLVSDTTTNFLGLTVAGKVTALNGIKFNNLLYPMAPPLIYVCDTTIPIWWKQSMFVGRALVTMPCTWVGIGESGVSNLPDAPLSISNRNSSIQLDVVNPTSLHDVFKVNLNGVVVIGDSTTTPGNYGLYVHKGILTSIVKIALPSGSSWSDYVFGNNYKLKSLPEVENYIKENKHLPDVPSADSVQKNGINVGEMDAVMMKKIEELTIYIIQQDKKIETLQNEVNALSNSNKK